LRARRTVGSDIDKPATNCRELCRCVRHKAWLAAGLQLYDGLPTISYATTCHNVAVGFCTSAASAVLIRTHSAGNSVLKILRRLSGWSQTLIIDVVTLVCRSWMTAAMSKEQMPGHVLDLKCCPLQGMWSRRVQAQEAGGMPDNNAGLYVHR
jgi:hypothetical protein